jgi:hypothetical protein
MVGRLQALLLLFQQRLLQQHLLLQPILQQQRFQLQPKLHRWHLMHQQLLVHQLKPDAHLLAAGHTLTGKA